MTRSPSQHSKLSFVFFIALRKYSNISFGVSFCTQHPKFHFFHFITCLIIRNVIVSLNGAKIKFISVEAAMEVILPMVNLRLEQFHAVSCKGKYRMNRS